MKTMMKTVLATAGISLYFFAGGLVFGQDDMQVCTQQYEPVCGLVEVQCITAPCEPVLETFGNSCELGLRDNARYLYDGECDDTKRDVVVALSEQLADLSEKDPVLGGSWYITKLSFAEDSNEISVVYEDGHVQEEMELVYTNEDGEIVFEKQNTQEQSDLERIGEVFSPYLDRFIRRADQILRLEMIQTKVNELLAGAIDGQARYYLDLIKEYVVSTLEQLRGER